MRLSDYFSSGQFSQGYIRLGQVSSGCLVTFFIPGLFVLVPLSSG